MFTFPAAVEAGILMSVHPSVRATRTISVPASAVAWEASATAAAASMLSPAMGRSPAMPIEGCPTAPRAASAARLAASKCGPADPGSPVTIDSIAIESSDRAAVRPRTRARPAQMPSRTSRAANVAMPAMAASATRFPRVLGRRRPDGAGSEAIAADPTAGRSDRTISPARGCPLA